MRAVLSSSQSLHVSISSNDSNVKFNDKNLKAKKDITSNSISNQLKKNNPLKSLMEQKQKISESRQKYLDEALSKNEDAKTIKEKLAEYDKQIAEIDKQINELKLEEQKKHIGNEEKEKKNDKVENTETKANTKPDKADEMMNDLLSASKNAAAAKTISAEKKSEIGEKKVLEIEIKLDEGRRPSYNPMGKGKRVADIENNLNKMDKEIGEKLNSGSSKNVDNKPEDSEDKKNIDKIDESIKYLKIKNTINIYEKNMNDSSKSNGDKLNNIA